MFEAYSEKAGKVISISEAFDYKERFYCPNPECNAIFIVKGITGHKAKHFARLSKTPHIEGCMYEKGSVEYVDNGSIKKIAPSLILRGSVDNKVRRTKSKANANNLEKNEALRITTPKQLLKYCLSNSLKTEYLPGIKVDDLILDSRNLVKEGRFEGVKGIKILVASYVRSFPPNMIQLRLAAKTKHNKEVYLRAWVRMEPECFNEIEEYLEKTYKKKGISNPTLAVMGEWKIEQKYLISCQISNKKQIMLL